MMQTLWTLPSRNSDAGPSMTAYVWTDAKGKIDTSLESARVAAAMLSTSGIRWIFDNRQTIKLFVNKMQLSAYHQDVLTNGSSVPWAAHEIVSLADLFRKCYRQIELNTAASVGALYELYGNGSSVSNIEQMRQLTNDYAWGDVYSDSSAVNATVRNLYSYLYNTSWLATLLANYKTPWEHASNMKSTSAVIDIWTMIDSMRGHGMMKAIDSGFGIRLRRDGRNTWMVLNRPKKIPTDAVIVVPFDQHADNFATAMTLMSPSINEHDEMRVNSMLREREVAKDVKDALPALTDVPQDATDVVCIPQAFFSSFTGRYSRGNDTLAPLDVAVRIRLLQAARGVSQ